MNCGHLRLRYIFNTDGSYSFKSERNHTPQRWWTIEESGSFSLNGDTLTINGVVQETRANPLEEVTYKWTTHYFEVSARPTSFCSRLRRCRDGILGGKSLFPNAYSYSQGDKLELRF